MSLKHENKKLVFGDTWHLSDGKKVHMYCLQYRKGDLDPKLSEVGGISHYSSSDLLKWKFEGQVLERGKDGSYDDLDLWTGCTIFENGKYYLYYTSRSSCGYTQSVSVATSFDNKTYKKHEKNPLFIPDKKYYATSGKPNNLAVHGNVTFKDYDCRDLCVVKNEDDGFYYGFFATRINSDTATNTAVIGLAKSKDLIVWEQLPPAFSPKAYHCIETPDVFKINGKWYMLCLSGNCYGGRKKIKGEKFQRITIYGVSDKIEGPYKEVKDNDLIVNKNASAACAKTVLHKGKRYIFYSEVYEDPDGPVDVRMSLPKIVSCDKKGNLYLKWYDKIKKYYTKDVFEFNKNNVLDNKGEWGSIAKYKFTENGIEFACENDFSVLPFNYQMQDFVLEGKICNENAISAGFVFDLKDNLFGEGYVSLIDFEDKKAEITKVRTFPTFEKRTITKKKSYNLKLLVQENTVEVYIDDKFIFHHLLYRTGGKIGLFIEHGAVRIENLKLHALKDF